MSFNNCLWRLFFCPAHQVFAGRKKVVASLSDGVPGQLSCLITIEIAQADNDC